MSASRILSVWELDILHQYSDQLKTEYLLHPVRILVYVSAMCIFNQLRG